jgi:hypothetical protein
MREQPNREPAGEEQPPRREPYAPPRLVRHGTEDLTRGGLSPNPGDPPSGLT